GHPAHGRGPPRPPAGGGRGRGQEGDDRRGRGHGRVPGAAPGQPGGREGLDRRLRHLLGPGPRPARGVSHRRGGALSWAWRGVGLGRLLGFPVRLDLSWFAGLAVLVLLSRELWAPAVAGGAGGGLGGGWGG